jgi:mannosyltransferase
MQQSTTIEHQVSRENDVANLTSAPNVTEPRKSLWWLLLFVVFVVGAYLRFRVLGVRSLWPPECFSILVAREPWPMFLRTMWWGEGNMAFYYILLRGWLHLGDSEAWLESLSALFGVLTIPAVYALGSRFLSRQVGLIAATLLAIHSFHVERSGLLRSYSLLTLLVVLSTYSFLALVNSPRRKVLWGFYAVFSALALYAQIFAVFLLAGQWLALRPKAIRKLGVLKILGVGAAIVVAVSPLLAMMALENKGQLDWVPPLTLAGALNVLRGIVGADMLALRSPAASVILLLLCLLAWSFALRELFRPESSEAADSKKLSISVLAWTLAFPIVAMSAISLIKPILYPRFLLMCTPAAVLLAAQGLATIQQSIPRGRAVVSTVLGAMIILSLIGTHKFETTIQNSGLDWRGVSNYILAHREPGDAIVFYTFGGNWTWDYYVARAREAGDNAPVPPTLFPLTFEHDSIARRIGPYRRLWLVLQQDIPTPQSDANTALLVKTAEENFHLLEEKEFGGENMYPGEHVSIHLALYGAPSWMRPR